jgi:leader peptidase (prepilin peptidase)/N-methyltransferase
MTAVLQTLHPAVLAAMGSSFGAIIGSYIGALVLRWPKGTTTITGRSRCDNCYRQLKWFELIPLLSFLIGRGRCRTCRVRINPVQPLAESLAAGLCGLAFCLMPPMEATAWSLLLLLLLPLALLDARHYWLPDRLILLLAAAGLALGGYTSGSAPLITRLTGAIAAFALLELVRRLFRQFRKKDGMGSGDPKMLAAIALWISPYDLPILLLTAAMLGLLAGWIMAVKGRLRNGLPFGTMLAIASVVLGFSMQLS